jgi:hypothetical protein
MPFTVGNMFGTTHTVRGPSNAARATVACSCPACTGLQCLERPRFFSGQLLSEAELNGETDYILAKQRLHNRYLHGVGTVCGLEVVCSNCDGQVIIKPGYAIDPCGNDIIVCQEMQFDVLKAIKACCDAMKKQSKTGCDPFRPASDPGCTGLEQHWCITIAYQEIPTQPITPLRGPQKTCSCAGSCSTVGSCGCSQCNGSTTTQSNGCSAPASSTSGTTTPTACEPTRILESFQLGVVPDPENCATPETLFQNTLLFKLFECFSTLTNLSTNFSPTTWNIIVLAGQNQLVNSQTSNADAFAACCQFRQFVIDLFTKGDFATKCMALNTFDSLPCPQPPSTQTGVTFVGGGGSDPTYLQQVQDTINATGVMLLEYVRECICHALLPSCPTDPGDDRLILACLTIKDGKITDICNFGCRQFAGAFPSFFYWLSIIPIVPLLKLLVDDVCCGPEFLTKRSPLVNNLAKIDPAGVLQKAIMDGNFALPKMLMDRMGDVVQRFSLQGLIGSIPANGLNLATLRGMSAENAQSSLKSFGVSYEQQQVNSRADIPLLPQTPTALGDLVMPFAQSGDHVVLYETAGTVVEVQRAGRTQAGGFAQAVPADVSDLRKQVESLKADIADLKKAAQAKKK